MRLSSAEKRAVTVTLVLIGVFYKPMSDFLSPQFGASASIWLVLGFAVAFTLFLVARKII